MREAVARKWRVNFHLQQVGIEKLMIKALMYICLINFVQKQHSQSNGQSSVSPPLPILSSSAEYILSPSSVYRLTFVGAGFGAVSFFGCSCFFASFLMTFLPLVLEKSASRSVFTVLLPLFFSLSVFSFLLLSPDGSVLAIFSLLQITFYVQLLILFGNINKMTSNLSPLQTANNNLNANLKLNLTVEPNISGFRSYELSSADRGSMGTTDRKSKQSKTGSKVSSTLFLADAMAQLKAENELEELAQEYGKVPRVKTEQELREEKLLKLAAYIEVFNAQRKESARQQAEFTQRSMGSTRKKQQNQGGLRPDPYYVKLFFETFKQQLGEFPVNQRAEIFMLTTTKSFSLKKQVYDVEQSSPDMHFIVSGGALMLKTKQAYRSFMAQQSKIQEEQEGAQQAVQRHNYSELSKIGWAIIWYVTKNPALSQYITRRQQQMKAEEYDKMFEESVGQEKLTVGDAFGNFQDYTKNMRFRNHWIISTGAPLKVIKLCSEHVIQLFQKKMTTVNLKALERSFGHSTDVTSNLIAKLCRSSVEHEMPAGTILFHEDSPLDSIFLLKSGTCQTFSKKDPLLAEFSKNVPSGFQQLPATNQKFRLGIEQGQMSQSFRHFNISLREAGTWIGDEIIFLPEPQLGYSVKTVTACSLLEIGLPEFISKMPRDYGDVVKEISLQRQMLLLVRMQETIRAATSLKDQQEMGTFFENSLKNMITLHPWANKRIMAQMNTELQLEGTQRTTRQRDAIKIGTIEIDDENTQFGTKNQKEIVALKKFTKCKIISPVGNELEEETTARRNIDCRRQMQLQEQMEQTVSKKNIKVVTATKATDASDNRAAQSKQTSAKASSHTGMLLTLHKDVFKCPVDKLVAKDEPGVTFEATDAQQQDILASNSPSRKPMTDWKAQACDQYIEKNGVYEKRYMYKHTKSIERFTTYYNKEAAHQEAVSRSLEPKTYFMLSQESPAMSLTLKRPFKVDTVKNPSKRQHDSTFMQTSASLYKPTRLNEAKRARILQDHRDFLESMGGNFKTALQEAQSMSTLDPKEFRTPSLKEISLEQSQQGKPISVEDAIEIKNKLGRKQEQKRRNSQVVLEVENYLNMTKLEAQISRDLFEAEGMETWRPELFKMPTSQDSLDVTQQHKFMQGQDDMSDAFNKATTVDLSYLESSQMADKASPVRATESLDAFNSLIDLRTKMAQTGSLPEFMAEQKAAMKQATYASRVQQYSPCKVSGVPNKKIMSQRSDEKELVVGESPMFHIRQMMMLTRKQSKGHQYNKTSGGSLFDVTKSLGSSPFYVSTHNAFLPHQTQPIYVEKTANKIDSVRAQAQKTGSKDVFSVNSAALQKTVQSLPASTGPYLNFGHNQDLPEYKVSHPPSTAGLREYDPADPNAVDHNLDGIYAGEDLLEDELLQKLGSVKVGTPSQLFKNKVLASGGLKDSAFDKSKHSPLSPAYTSHLNPSIVPDLGDSKMSAIFQQHPVKSLQSSTYDMSKLNIQPQPSQSPLVSKLHQTMPESTYKNHLNVKDVGVSGLEQQTRRRRRRRASVREKSHHKKEGAPSHETFSMGELSNLVLGKGAQEYFKLPAKGDSAQKRSSRQLTHLSEAQALELVRSRGESSNRLVEMDQQTTMSYKHNPAMSDDQSVFARNKHSKRYRQKRKLDHIAVNLRENINKDPKESNYIKNFRLAKQNQEIHQSLALSQHSKKHLRELVILDKNDLSPQKSMVNASMHMQQPRNSNDSYERHSMNRSSMKLSQAEETRRRFQKIKEEQRLKQTL